MRRMNIYKESRSARRVSFIGEVECSGQKVGCFTTRITDLSVTGAFIDSMMSFATGTILQMRFQVGETLIETQAEVRYALRQSGMGVRFIDLRPEYREVIECLIEGRPLPVTGGLEMTFEESDAEQTVLEGSFAAFSFFDVIHMIGGNRLNGALVIKLPDAVGDIYFRQGQIVGAKSGGATGLTALNHFVGAREGAFEFKQTSRRYDRTIEAANNTSLLLDLVADREQERVCS